nr:hypothetical protein [Tanacetum cinerariifolium]
MTIPNFRSAGNPFNTTIIPSPPLSSPPPSSIGALPPDIGAKSKDMLAGSSTKSEKIEMVSKKSKNKEYHVIDMTKESKEKNSNGSSKPAIVFKKDIQVIDLTDNEVISSLVFHLYLPLQIPDIKRNSTAYKVYYAIALGAAPPKTKASVRKMQSSSDTTMPPPTAAGTRLSTSAKGKQPAKKMQSSSDTTMPPPTAAGTRLSTLAKGKQPAKSSKAKGLYVDDDDVDDQSEADDDQEDEDEQDDDDQDDNDDDQDSNSDGDDFVHPKLSTHDEEAKDVESFDHIVQTPSHVEDSDDDEIHGMNVGGDEGPDAEDDDEELYRDVNINLEGHDVQMIDVHTTQVLEDTHVTLTPVNPDGQQQSSYVSSQFVTSMFNPSPDAGIDSLFKSTLRVDVPVTTAVVPLLATAPTLPPPSILIMSQVQQASAPTPTTASSTSLQDLPILALCSGLTIISRP